jgi:hypothetical protein
MSCSNKDDDPAQRKWILILNFDMIIFGVFPLFLMFLQTYKSKTAVLLYSRKRIVRHAFVDKLKYFGFVLLFLS